METAPHRRGVLAALLAALSFGVTAPLVKRFGVGVGPFATAALLYLGAAIAAAATGARPPRRDGLRLVAIALVGAAGAPALLAWGLQRSDASSASLLLNAEALFTVALAALLRHEPIGRRMALALALMLVAGALLVHGDVRGLSGSPGALAVVAAAFLWACDNTLTSTLALQDPATIVLAKATLGALASGAATLLLHEPGPTPAAALVLLACGATGYGLSLRLYVLAQRLVGAARTGSVFAVGPFVGALLAPALAHEAWPGPVVWVAGGLFALGVALHLSERHSHRHAHVAVTHDHPHRHDDGHHDHAHAPPFVGEHAHPHHHDAVEHEHDHAPDVHHLHSH